MMELVKKLRKELGDIEEPFLHSDDKLIDRLTEAVYDYSRYRPSYIDYNLKEITTYSTFVICLFFLLKNSLSKLKIYRIYS
ncbi:hypothetical protein EEL32_09840 [Brevibacillus laterosporus]|uniref:Uncharacterized protein n=1 Tax=Brevibacillus laterosporus TaxID=1465 RepID=A0A502ISM1_BRELA|nr:hypothetical protein [Brevibacillus laterosporus]QDX95463.1 hypothetical protein EEL30_26265 [Brevibacillus laterosporus]TPG88436.1 hypothetical protein EEL32_09840 [Brevibacillus laterosporus]